MKQRSRVLAVATGATLALVGAIVTVVYLFQPWRTCPYDDSPAACAMLPADATVLAIAVCATLIGVLILVLGLLLRPASRPAEGSHRAAARGAR